MKSLRSFTFCCFVASLSACVKQSQTTEKTVVIPQTEVRNQERTGFCWSFTSHALIEALYKAKTGKTIDLAEGYLGVIALSMSLESQIEEAQKDADPVAARKKVIEGITKGAVEEANWLISPSGNKRDGFTLLKNYGVVTEKDFPLVAPKTKEERLVFREEFAKRVEVLWKDPATKISREDIIKHVYEKSPMFPEAFPTQVEFDGKKVTPTEMLSALSFDPNSFAAIYTKSAADFEPMMNAIKKTMHDGIPVPFGFSADHDRIENGEFGGASWESLNTGNGHYVLATDYKNRGGAEGAMSPELQKIELEKHPNLLDYILIKNSWGFEKGSVTGYFKLSKDFIMANMFSFANKVIVVDLILPKKYADEFNEKQKAHK